MITKNIILLSFDTNYYIKYGKYCLLSILKNSFNETIFVRTIDAKNDVIKEISSLSSRINISNIIKPIRCCMKDFSAQIRTKIISEELLNYDIEKLLYIDADSLMMRSPELLWDLVNEYDISGWYCGSTSDIRRRYRTGILVIKNTNISKETCKIWNCRTWEKIAFWQDQIGLCNAVEYMIDKGLRFNNLKNKNIIDSTDLKIKNSILWTPGGKYKRYCNFIEQQQKFLE